jgi:hypothetical protein
MSDFGEELTLSIKEPLLQHRELVRAKEIKKPQEIPKPKLDLWLSFARELCNTQGYMCLAFTELGKMTREQLGFSEELPPRVIFYRTEMESGGELVINPKSETSFENNQIIPIFENCGSIENKKLMYIFKRPGTRSLRGYFFDGNKTEKKVLLLDGPYVQYTDLSLHETDHVDGNTALKHPESLCDIRSTADWQLIMQWYSKFSEAEIREMIEEASPDGLLVYDKQNKIFCLVNAAGQFIRQYTP